MNEVRPLTVSTGGLTNSWEGTMGVNTGSLLLLNNSDGSACGQHCIQNFRFNNTTRDFVHVQV